MVRRLCILRGRLLEFVYRLQVTRIATPALHGFGGGLWGDPIVDLSNALDVEPVRAGSGSAGQEKQLAKLQLKGSGR